MSSEGVKLTEMAETTTKSEQSKATADEVKEEQVQVVNSTTTDVRKYGNEAANDRILEILTKRFRGLRPRNEREGREVRKAAEGVTGTVKWFNVQSGYGFVCRDDTNEDVFVHHSSIEKPNPMQYQHSLEDGERIRFDVGETHKGLEAINVTGEDGGNVQGSRFAWVLAQIPPPHIVRYLYFIYFPRIPRRGGGGRRNSGRGKARSVSEGESESGRRHRRPRALEKPRDQIVSDVDIHTDKPPRRRSGRPRPRRQRPDRRSSGQKVKREEKEQDVDMRSDDTGADKVAVTTEQQHKVVDVDRPKKRYSQGRKSKSSENDNGAKNSNEEGDGHKDKEASTHETGIVRKTVQNIELGGATAKEEAAGH